jgi:hypothetical protein
VSTPSTSSGAVTDSRAVVALVLGLVSLPGLVFPPLLGAVYGSTT